jgi:mannose-1-phosphate guanylyltransferase
LLGYPRCSYDFNFEREAQMGRGLLRVSRFWEKPTVRDAKQLHRRECLWNTFVTIGFAGAFLELLQATVPRLTRLLGSNPDVDRLYHETRRSTSPRRC